MLAGGLSVVTTRHGGSSGGGFLALIELVRQRHLVQESLVSARVAIIFIMTLFFQPSNESPFHVFALIRLALLRCWS